MKTATVEGAKTRRRETNECDFLAGKARGKGEPRGGNLVNVCHSNIKEICPGSVALVPALVPILDRVDERDREKLSPRTLLFPSFGHLGINGRTSNLHMRRFAMWLDARWKVEKVSKVALHNEGFSSRFMSDMDQSHNRTDAARSPPVCRQ